MMMMKNLPDFNQPIETEVTKPKSLPKKAQKGKKIKKTSVFDSQEDDDDDDEEEDSIKSELSEDTSDGKQISKGKSDEEDLLAEKLEAVNLSETQGSETSNKPENAAPAPPESSEEEEESEDEETILRKKKEAGKICLCLQFR